jgi:N-terminal domain of (some) glycogen debranching enzymes
MRPPPTHLWSNSRYFRIEIGFGADYHDLFEVRGTSRRRRGTCTAKVTENSVEYLYKGIDRLKRGTMLLFWPPPSRLETNRMMLNIELAPVTLRVGPLRGPGEAAIRLFWTFIPR